MNKTRLLGDLPIGTSVAHRTGTSGAKGNVAAATNDIGLIRMRDGRELTIAIFLTDSTGNDAARDKVLAPIARATYEACLPSK